MSKQHRARRSYWPRDGIVALLVVGIMVAAGVAVAAGYTELVG